MSLDETVRSSNGRLESKFIKGEPGRNGLDGLPGLDGAPGLDGIPGIDGRNGRDGIDGRDGKDGKDGQLGERGQPGLPGPAGEVGRRGKPGPAGKTGAPGPPGVCVYRAKYDCALLSTNGSSSSSNTNSSSSNQQYQSQALLLAPTMVGQSSGNDNDANEERQVTVTESDNIQLSCEAFALPKPTYVWHRSDRKSTILLDVATLFKVTSFPGSQLPFVKVDRLQAGTYECVASNGIPPVAKKRINLDVNYAPTIRIYPGPSVYRVELGSSILIECIVEANPSSFSYFMFGSESLMSISPNTPLQPTSSLNQALDSGSIDGDNKLNDGFDGTDITSPSSDKESSFNVNRKQHRNSIHKKYIITESTGQLSTGASYSILTLNITNINRDDLGVYKCISKNLIGQSTGYVWLESLEDDSSLSSDLRAEDLKIRQLILEKSQIYERLDHTIDWPSYLVEREANYSTFGNDHRQQIVNLISRKLSGKPVSDEDSDHTITLLRRPSANKFNQTQQQIDTTETEQTLPNDKANSFPEEVDRQSITITTTSSLTESTNIQTTQNVDTETSTLAIKMTSGPSDQQASPIAVSKHEIKDDNSDSDNDIFELCRAELIIEQQNKPIERSSIMLLDQVGKPVYLGNMAENSLDWWSLDSKLQQQLQQSGDGTHNTKVDQNQFDLKSHYFSTSPNHPDKLFEYESLNDLLKDQQHVVAYNGDNSASEETNKISSSSPSSHIIHKLKHNMYGNSHLLYGGSFYYVSFLNDSRDMMLSQNHLDNLSIVIVDIKKNLYRYVNLNGKLTSAFEDQPMNLDLEYKLNRVELASDENGVWIILPTIEKKSHLMRIPSKYKDSVSIVTMNTNNQSNNSQQHYNNKSKITKLDNYQGRWQEKQKKLMQTLPINQLHLSETRRLHVLKLRSNIISNENENENNNSNIDNFAKSNGDDTVGDNSPASGYNNNNNNNITRMIDYHVSMKLDWRMIGQIFIIDGVLYGIKDRHLYSSKLQFAYDLYKCKLLSTEYLNESHRTFTNHFGNTQMIKYNPNEPKRLYTIDSGNLLWCPVKLIKTNPDDIWQQQQQQQLSLQNQTSSNNKLS